MKLRNEEYNGKEQKGQEKRKTGNDKLSSTNLENYTHYERIMEKYFNNMCM